MSVNIFDPMDVITNSNERDVSLALEKLNIYVDFKAYRRGTSEIIFNNEGFLSINNTSDMYVDMMGKNEEGVYTSNWTKLESSFEGFGITNIKVKTNSSFIPQVSVEFTDIRGLNFLNKGKDSPYSVLLDFPPPIFELTLKGYFGKPIKYSLHLVENDIKFDDATGNYIIHTDFIANTFAPLTDILFQYIVHFPLMYEEVNLMDDEVPNSTYELIKRVDKLYKTVDNFVRNTGEYKIIGTNRSNITNINRIIFSLNYKEFVNSKDEPSLFKFCIVDDKYNTKIIDNIDKYIVESDDELYLITTLDNQLVKNSRIEKYFNDKVSNVIKQDFSFEYGNITIVENDNDVNYKFMNITSYIQQIELKKEFYNKETIQNQNSLDDKLHEYAKKNIGFLPTIRNIMTIICNDVDKMFEIFRHTDKQAIIHHRNNFPLMENNGYKDIKNGNIYSFPLFIERQRVNNSTKECRTYPKNELFASAPLPETQLIDDFINIYLNLKRRRDVESLYEYDEKTGGTRWYPISVLDTTLNYNVSNMETPYNFNKFQGDKFETLLNTIYERFMVLANYTYPYQLKYENKKSKQFLKFLAEAEGLNIVNSIVDEQYILMLNNKLNESEDLHTKINNLKVDYTNTNNIKTNKTDYSLKSNDDSHMIFILQDDVEEREDSTDIIDIYIESKRNMIEKLFNMESRIKFSNENIIFYDDVTAQINTYMPYSVTLNGILYSSNNIDINNITEIDVEKYMYISFFNSIQPFTAKNPMFDVKSVKRFANTFKSGIYKVPKAILLQMGGLLKHMNDETNEFFENLSKYNFELNLGRNRPVVTLGVTTIDFVLDLLNNIPNKDKAFLVELYDEYYNDDSLYDNFRKFYIEHFEYKRSEAYNEDDDLYKKLFNDYLLEPVNVGFLSDNIFMSNDEINSKYELNEKQFKDYVGFLSEKVKDNLKSVETKLENEKFEFFNSIDDNDIKTQLYYSFKNIVDKWVRGFDNTINYPFNNPGEKLIDKFIFVDRAMNDIGDECIINANDLIEMSKDTEINVFTVISRLLSQNGFEFFPLQNFINHSSNWEDSFKITQNVNSRTLTRPSFVCMYIGGASSSLDTNDNYIDDGLKELTDAEDFNNYYNPTTAIAKIDGVNYGEVNAFRVIYGASNQSVFKNIEVNTKETPETNESLAILSSLAQDGSNDTPVPKAQNLYSLYEKRSYNSKINMLGNVMIQPTQYYQLEGNNIFSGAYIILNVEHNITPNHMTTSFSGTRILRYPNPIVNNFTNSIGFISDNSLFDERDNDKRNRMNGYNGDIVADAMKYNAMHGDDDNTLKI